MNPTLDRTDTDFRYSKVQELLPEYFQTDYPDLVTFLQKYYEYLQDHSINNFETRIRDLLSIRDIRRADLSYINLLISEIGNGIQSADFFDQPRLMTSLLADFYRSKGSLNSIEGFFRGFYGEDVFIEYPKRNMFIVGESKIGANSLRFLQDNELYQIFSILIKASMSTAEYEQLYKRFVHPAGFYFAGQVLLENELVISTPVGLDSIDGVSDPLAELPPRIFASEISIGITPEFHELTGIYTQNDSNYRVSLTENINKYLQVSTNDIVSLYGNDWRINDLQSPNSFTFDDSGPNMSLTFETMDNDMFTRYLSDSSY